jgi:polyhydroxyalkanoate synthesis regulator phasin
MMEDTLKKIMYTGLGFLSLTKNKVEEMIDDLVDKGRLSREEGQRIMKDFKKDSATSREAMENEMKQWVENAMSKMDIAQKKDLDQLREEVEALQRRVTAIEGPNVIK